MRTYSKILFFLSIPLICFSCKEQMSQSDREAGREGTQSQEIRRIGEVEIITAGLERGRNISEASQKTLGSTLKAHIESDGIESSLKFCNLNAYPLIDSLSQLYSADIRRVSQKIRNPENRPDSVEAVLLDAYQYTIERGDQVTENIQEVEGKYLLYTKPIMIGDPVCLQCHGKSGQELTEETIGLLRTLYPSDQATGYGIAEMRGMWSIRIDKKSLVNSL